MNVKVIDIQNKDYIFTEYESDIKEAAFAKLKRIHGLEIEEFKIHKEELRIYCYIDH